MTFKYLFTTCAYAGRCVEYDSKINTDPALKELRVVNGSFSYLHAMSSKHLLDHFLNKTRAELGSYVGVECQVGRMATLLPKAQGEIPRWSYTIWFLGPWLIRGSVSHSVHVTGAATSIDVKQKAGTWTKIRVLCSNSFFFRCLGPVYFWRHYLTYKYLWKVTE